MGEGGWGREKEGGGGREERKEEEGKVESGVVRREGGYRAMSKLIWIWSQPCIHIMQAMWGKSWQFTEQGKFKVGLDPETRSFTVAEFHDLENSC